MNYWYQETQEAKYNELLLIGVATQSSIMMKSGSFESKRIFIAHLKTMHSHHPKAGNNKEYDYE